MVILVILVGLLGLVFLKYWTNKKGLICLPKRDITPSSNPTEDWEIYRNDEGGFEFKYPPRQFIENTSRDLYATPYVISSLDLETHLEFRGGDWSTRVYDRGGSLVIMVDALSHTKSWEEFKKGERTSPCNVVKLNTGVEAIYETRSYPAAYDEDTVTFFWEGTQASTQYQIIIEYAGDEKDKYQEIFKQVLSTFKFTD